LIAPTTDTGRIRRISRYATGFLYYISITGVTGTARPRAVDIERDVERIRRITTLPLVVGFGISTPRQAGEIAPNVDGIVVGSAFVRMIEENRDSDNLMRIVSAFVRKFKKAVSGRRGF